MSADPWYRDVALPVRRRCSGSSRSPTGEKALVTLEPVEDQLPIAWQRSRRFVQTLPR